MSIQVTIVEDDAGVRESLSTLISWTAGFSCIGSYPTGEAALNHIPHQRPDVILMDIHLPGLSGVECAARLKELLPGVPIVMLTVYDDEESLFRALRAGAAGYLLKRTRPDKLLASIRDVVAGGAPMSAQIARMVVRHFHQSPSAPEINQLTAREREILAALAQGYRYKEIADQLGVSFNTIRSHIRSIYEKLHVQSCTEAVVKYIGKDD